MTRLRPVILVIAGSDSSGGAGLQRDLRVVADLGGEAVAAVTAVTAQSDRRVASVFTLPASLLREQIEAALETCPVAAVKIGMLATQATVQAVADSLAALAEVPIVVDPVLASSSGAVLLDEAGREALRSLLLPVATLVTPNLAEAAALLGVREAIGEGEMLDQAQRLRRLGARAVLVKGGHGQGQEAVDVLVEDGREPVRLAAPRLPASMRGTGCALSTAIACHLALGAPLASACVAAKTYVSAQLRKLLSPSDRSRAMYCSGRVRIDHLGPSALDRGGTLP